MRGEGGVVFKVYCHVLRILVSVGISNIPIIYGNDNHALHTAVCAA